MQTWRVSPLVAAVAVGLVLAGCGPQQRGSDVPMPTTSPKEVVIKVPGMT